MKKIYTITAAILIGMAVNAQNTNAVSPNNVRHQTIYNAQFHPGAGSRSSSEGFYMNNDSADSFNTITINGQTYQSNQIQDFNMYYRWPLDSTQQFSDPVQFGIVAFDSLFDPYSYQTYTTAGITSFLVDSLFLEVGQENLSGQPDTLVTEIHSVDSHGYPTTTVLWTNTLPIPANASLSLTGVNAMNNWLAPATVALMPNLILPSGTKFAVEVKYYGNHLDTFGITYGFPYFNGTCPNAGELANPTSFSTLNLPAVGSQSPAGQLFANSFAYHINRNLGLGNLFPQEASNGYLFYDCNGNNTYDQGIDGRDYIEDFNIIAHVTATLGISQNADRNFDLYQNQPNPFSDLTTINYELKTASKNVALQIFDVTGVKVFEKTQTNVGAGKYSVDINNDNLASGIYFYSLTVDGSSLNKKMVVAK